VFLSLASITNLAGRAYVHHGDYSAYLTGAGIAVLVPIAVLAAMLIDGKWSYLFWCMALVFAGISGTIQFNIYLLDDTWLSVAEAIAFGYGVPVSEVMLAVMEARLVVQIDEKKAAEMLQAAAIAKVEQEQLEAAQRAEEERQAALQREAEDREFDRRKKEAELNAYELKLAQDAAIEREQAMMDLRIKEQRASAKIIKPDSKHDSGSDSGNQKGLDYEFVVIDYFARNPLASQRTAADETGISQSKVSKTLTALESRGIIHRNGNGVEILRS
jgi:CRP-like cAMP-binding protein